MSAASSSAAASASPLPARTARTVRTDPTARPPLSGRSAVLALTAGIFSLVTTEILPIGLLTPIGATFRISDGAAGLMMTIPGLLAALAAPTVTAATARIDRRPMLWALLLVLAAADLLSALAPAYWTMLLARILVGLVIGAFWSIGSGLADRLVAERHRAVATAVIFSAVPLGSVLGVPAGVYLGDLAGWRTAFLAMAALSLLVAAALALTLPPLPPLHATRLAVLRGLLGDTPVRTGLLVTLLVVTAHFGSYTYITPFLADEAHAGPGLITAALLAYGAAGIAGTFAAGPRARRALRPTFTAAAGLLAAATLLLPVLGTGRPGALLLLLVWGFAYGAVPVCSQAWFLAAAPHAPEAASVLFTASFQATISLGALAGGAVVDAASTPTVMVLGGVTALLALGAMRLRGAPGGGGDAGAAS
ncbi:MFS transporter [Kitasatospora sp. NBC_00085]|uniref:MFS transporter n=1 Tax=unclassified Kitasatospora TaxID=2633591 RepID=UPI002F907E8E